MLFRSGGACDDERVVGAQKWSPKRVQDFHDRVEDVKGLLTMLNADHYFRYACPTKQELDTGKAVMLKWNRDLKPTQHYLTDAWHESLLKHRIHFPYEQHDTSHHKKLQIAVHVRRGDLTPCHQTPINARRYMPNSYFLQILDDYLPQYCGSKEDFHFKCDVVIHSESKALEPLNVFAERGYKLELDGELEDVWKSFINADLLVAADSAFSYVPAVLNRNVVLFPPSEDKDYNALPGWTILSEDYVTNSHADWQKLRDDGCQFRHGQFPSS